MLRLRCLFSYLFTTIAVFCLLSWIHGDCLGRVPAQGLISQPQARLTAEANSWEPIAPALPHQNSPMLVSQASTGRPRERLRDRLRERLEERRKKEAAADSSFAPGLQPLPGTAGPGDLGAHQGWEPRPLVERFRRILGDLGLSVGAADSPPLTPGWDYRSSPEPFPTSPDRPLQPNFPAVPAPQPIQSAPPGTWLKSQDAAAGSVTVPQDASHAEKVPSLPQASPSAATVPSLPLLVPPDFSVVPEPSAKDGRSVTQAPTDSRAETGDSGTPGNGNSAEPPSEDIPGGTAANSAGTNTFGQLLGGVSRLFGGNASTSKTARPAEFSGSTQSAAGKNPSQDSPTSGAASRSSDLPGPSAGSTVKPSLEEIRKKVLRRSSSAN